MNDNVVTLREFFQTKLDAMDARFAQYVLDMAERLQRTERDLERRLEGMNEFRTQLERQAGSFITREYYEAKYGIMDSRVANLEKVKNTREGQLVLIAAVLVVLVQIGLAFFHK